MGITKAEALKAVDRERGPVCEASDRIWDQPETDRDRVFRYLRIRKAGSGHSR